MRFEDEHGEFKQCRWCKGRDDCFLPQDHACYNYEFDIVARNRCIKEDTRERERERIIAELDRKARNEKKVKKEEENARKKPVTRLKSIGGKWCYVYDVETTSNEKLTFILESPDSGYVVFPDGEKEELQINRDKNNQRIFVYGKKNKILRITSESLTKTCQGVSNFKKFIETHSLHF